MRNFITQTDRVLHVHHPRVVVETAARFGADPGALFANTELTPALLTSPEMRVSYEQYAILSANALHLTGEPALGIHVGKNTGIAQMGVLALLLPNSPTVGAALDAMMRYSRAFTPLWEFRLETRGETGFLTFRETLPLGPFRGFAHEVMLAAFDTHTRELYGSRPAPVRRVELPFEEPAHAARYRDLLYDVPMTFGHDVARVEFDARMLNAPIQFADPATFKIAEQFCHELLTADSLQDGLLAQVRRLLAAERDTPPSLPEVARSLRTSTRTLRRELQRMRTSYSELLDDARQERAEELLQATSVPMDRLAQGLGFSTVGSFRRAYRRWTGRALPTSRAR